ncbi:MAG: carbamoyl-phosphate synthase large subunit [Campylobacteraceae bacterium]|nr:carbamoyl-phosphate synthase large subunit [Campylobacteraceae bacterium]
MPRRDDFKSVLVIGSGPIVIGQACEFDYSGTQAIKTLKEEGYRVVLINSNPATIMTDLGFADATYIEPITKESILRIIEKEKIDAIFPTLGGQVALNAGMEVYESGVDVKFIGINPEAIKKGEDRALFKQTMLDIGMDLPISKYAYNMNEAMEAASEIGFPLIIRASYTLGGAGSGVAYNIDEFKEIAENGLKISPAGEILIEESLLGWKEIEMEVVIDKNDKAIIVCSIENFDPMGVHTGDSIAIAPAQTLTKEELDRLTKASFDVVRAVGVSGGGSNVQFGLHPKTGRMVIIEMNPRVSRSSALASKATGYPIAKVATLMAIGYTLDEIDIDIWGAKADKEPAVNYIVTKIPKFAFEKFSGSNPTLGTAMKSVGEVMSIGGNFKESMQKALLSMESDLKGFDEIGADKETLIYKLRHADDKRILYIAQAFREGFSVDEVYDLTKIEKFFLNDIAEIVEFEKNMDMAILNDKEEFKKAKAMGFSDAKIAEIINEKDGLELTGNDVYFLRKKFDISQIYSRVGKNKNYLYSKFSDEPSLEVANKDKKKVLIIGSGPNRIGQGIEFDYCCVHASYALADMGITSIMYNSNPETVSTDYDTSDILYFEPITFEHLREVIDREKPDGVIVHFGGQTPLKFAKRLGIMGVDIIGTSPKVIDMAEDRKKFSKFITDLGIKQPDNGTATSMEEAIKVANEIGYPVLVRPSYVLGGRAMRKVANESELREYIDTAVSVSDNSPVLIDKFLDMATELDIDAISDGKDVFIGALLEHVEEAGIHSGDSVSITPPPNLTKEMVDEIYQQTKKIAINLGVVGLLNIQFAIYKDEIYIIEVNPRASRTVPFISKAVGVPMAKVATRVMWQGNLKEALEYYDSYKKVVFENGIYTAPIDGYSCVKESVFPFNKLVGSDIVLGPEMKSTGEVMGISDNVERSFIKSQISGNNTLPSSGKVLVSLADKDKDEGIALAKNLVEQGFTIMATAGTNKTLAENGIESEFVYKIGEGRPNVADTLQNGDISLVVNTSDNVKTSDSAAKIRALVLRLNVPYFTTVKAANLATQSVKYIKDSSYLEVKSLQEWIKG